MTQHGEANSVLPADPEASSNAKRKIFDSAPGISTSDDLTLTSRRRTQALRRFEWCLDAALDGADRLRFR